MLGLEKGSMVILSDGGITTRGCGHFPGLPNKKPLKICGQQIRRAITDESHPNERFFGEGDRPENAKNGIRSGDSCHTLKMFSLSKVSVKMYLPPLRVLHGLRCVAGKLLRIYRI